MVSISAGCSCVARRRWRCPDASSSRSHCGWKRAQNASTEQYRSSKLIAIPPDWADGFWEPVLYPVWGYLPYPELTLEDSIGDPAHISGAYLRSAGGRWV